MRRSDWEECESGRIGRSRKPLWSQGHRGFESHLLRKPPPPRSAPSLAFRTTTTRTSRHAKLTKQLVDILKQASDPLRVRCLRHFRGLLRAFPWNDPEALGSQTFEDKGILGGVSAGGTQKDLARRHGTSRN